MRLLLDSHLAKALAQELRRHGLDAVALAEWGDGSYRNVTDTHLLALCNQDRRVLVTYDRRTTPPLLKELAETGQHHAGVVLVDSRTFRSNDIGGLLSALRPLVSQAYDDWEDRVVFLMR